jgi:hypothetical protein
VPPKRVLDITKWKAMNSPTITNTMNGMPSTWKVSTMRNESGSAVTPLPSVSDRRGHAR